MKPLAHNKWPALALDLAVMTRPGSPVEGLEDIYNDYGIGESTLKEILTVPEFQRMYREALATVRDQGTNAGHIYRAMALSRTLSEKLFNDAMDGAMEPKEALKLLEMLMRSGGILDAQDKQTQVNVQNNIGIALPIPKGIPKLKHLGSAY